MIILDGKKLADKILSKLKKEIKMPIKLTVILIGENATSLNFIKQKQKAAQKIGIGFKLFQFDKNINEQELVKKIKEIVKDKTNTGIIIQLPTPLHINTQTILDLIPPERDPDALSVDNSLVEPPTASGIIKILKEYKIGIKGKKTVIVGKGRLVGKPLSAIMTKAGANLIICDSQTKNLKSETLKADILISATGQHHLIKKNMIKKGIIVIDAGAGDVDFKNVKIKTDYITPPIGGIGPMTVAMLMSNLIKLAKK